MSKNRELKEQAVAEIVEKIREAQSITLVSYTGLTVEQVTALRKTCRESGVQYVVLKNRLVKLALADAGIEGMDDLLNGPNAFVYSMSDAVSAPKTISQFIEKNKLTSLKVTGGIFENKVADEKTMDALSKMPSRDELLGTLVGCLVSPVSALVAVLDEIAEKKEAA